MQKALFQEYHVFDLVRVIENKLDQLEGAAFNSPTSVKARQDALQVLSAYELKDRNGRPSPPVISESEQNVLIEIDLTRDEADQLGVTGKRITLRDLQKLASRETTSRESDNARRRSYAAYLLAHGTKRYDKYNSSVTDSNIRYAIAVDAFAILSTPAASMSESDARLIEHGNAILATLRQIQASDSANPMDLMAEMEYAALGSGQFDKVDNDQLSSAGQKMRRRVNECVEHMHQKRADVSGIPFRAFFNPRKIADIEALMNCDTTATWLLQAVKNAALPVILCEYVVPDHELPKDRLAVATYVIDHLVTYRVYRGGGAANTSASKTIDYIKLFTNLLNDHDIASSYAHEARHFWQEQVAPRSGRLSISPIDEIVCGLLFEADARAIEGKVAWGIQRKTGQSCLRSIEGYKFQVNFSNRSPRNSSLATKVKKATQAGFIGFLEGEFSNPAYLDTYIAQSLSAGHDLRTWCRALPESRFLADDFLTQLSQVGQTAHYLDEEGIDAVRRLFLARLPQAVANYGPAPAGTSHRYG